MAKPQETFEEHWRARHRRGLEAAHRKLRAAFRDLDCYSSHVSLDDMYKAAGLYREAMEYPSGFDEEEDDYRVMDRWTDVFDRTWKREMRKNLLEAFDIALSSRFRAIGKPWPQETAAHNVTPIMGKRAA
jgi:hypothetical protein